MSIVVDYEKILQKAAPKAKLKRILNKDLSLKKAALMFVDGIDFLDRKAVTSTALKVIKNYRKRAKDLSRAEIRELATNPKQLIHQVQNEVVYEIAQEIKGNYPGEKYKWLASDAEEPDPEHQLLYGEIRTIGDGEMPGERPGCRCGMEILVEEKTLEL
jgi:hypothetical protein